MNFAELCEYLGSGTPCAWRRADWICTDWAFQKGDSEDFCHPEQRWRITTGDCLDTIEYAAEKGEQRTIRSRPAVCVNWKRRFRPGIL